jgi:transcriptional regulator with XRE-family HTH domain
VDNIGQRVKEERQFRGWSQRDLARETGVNTDTISGIETGQHEPRPSTMRKLAEGLGIEVRDLFMEPVLPKAEAPDPGLSREQEELHRAIFQPWLDFVSRYADRWEERTETGEFDLGNVHEFLSTVEDIMPTLHELNRAEVRDLAPQPYSFGLPAARTGRAIERLLDLIDPMIAAGVSKFEKSELEQLRRRREATRRALGQTA